MMNTSNPRIVTGINSLIYKKDTTLEPLGKASQKVCLAHHPICTKLHMYNMKYVQEVWKAKGHKSETT